MPSNDINSSKCSFVIPLCSFERTILAGIKSQHCSMLDEAIQRLDEVIQSYADTSFLKDLGKALVASSNEPIQKLGVKLEGDGESDSPSLGSSLKTYLFRGWKFARATRQVVLLSQSPLGLRGRGGDHAKSYTSILSPSHKEGLFRLKILKEINANIHIRLSSKPPPRLDVVPAASDDSFWDIVLGMYLVGHLTQLQNINKKPYQVDHNPYGIWQMAQQFSLACRRPDNGNLVERYLFPLIDPKTVSGSWLVSRERKSLHKTTPLKLAADVADLPMHTLAMPDVNGEPTGESVTPPTRKAASRGSQPDPRDYVEVIPWMELKPVSPAVLEDAQIPISLPRRPGTSTSQEVSDVEWMVWKPPSSNFFDYHHLYTEDEVYQYCVENRWHFPGHFHGECVVFAMSSLNVSRFVDDLENFWERWNDCALTVNPSDNQLYLLETIPGRNYRLRRGHASSDQAGGIYFRNIVETHAQQQDSNAKINALLGKKYDIKYRFMLRYLQPGQLTEIDPKPLGSGSFGEVYGATWMQPTAYLRSMQPDNAKVAVVIKHILPKFHKTEAMEKLLHELDITFSALEGGTSSCVAFYGITTFPIDRTGPIQLSSGEFRSDGEERLFLVFERASEGNLLDFMEQNLVNAAREQSWSVVVAALTSIASGLDELHQRHIIHGDLHPGNVLATKRHYPDEDQEEYQYLLADFGGGGSFGYHCVTSSSGRFECRVGDYLAPEVKAGNGGSAEADVFSLGRIGRTLVSLRRVISSRKGSTDWETVPKALKGILDECTSIHRLERPQTWPLVSRMQELYVPKIMKDEDSWCVLDRETSGSGVFAAGGVPIQRGGHVARARAQVHELLRRFPVG